MRRWVNVAVLGLSLCVAAGALASIPKLTPFNLQPPLGRGAVGVIKEKIQECRQMADYLGTLVKGAGGEADTLSQAQDLLQGVIYQLTKLEGDLLASPGPTSLELPNVPPGPPYPLKLYGELLKSYSSITQRLEAARSRVSLMSEEIDSLQSEIKDLTAQWLSLQKKSPPSADFYLVLAQLLNSQARYLARNLELSRISKTISTLSSLKIQADRLLKRVFFHLDLEPKDLDAAQARAKAMEVALEKARVQVRRRLAYLTRQAGQLEAKKSEVVKRLKDPALGLKEKKDLRLEKERLGVLQEENQLERKKANEQEKRALLEFADASFQLQWIRCYLKGCSRQERVKNLELWNKRLERIENFLESTKIEFNRVQTISEITNSKLIALEQNPPAATRGDRAVSRLMVAYRRLIGTITSLSQLYQENMGRSRWIVLEMGYTLGLLKKRVGGIDRLYIWFSENRKAIVERVRSVLYYPLVTIGQIPFTLNTILRFILILVMGVFLVRLLRRKAYRLMTERFAFSPGLVNSLTTLIYYVLILVVFFVALADVGVDMKQVTIIFGALGVGIGFGMQTIANNFVSGIILLTERSIEAGDIVELDDGTLGEVARISIRSTIIRTYDGLDIIVPNSELVSGKVTTWTYEDDWRRLRIPFGVAYGTDPLKVTEVARQAALSVPSTAEDHSHPVQVWFEGLGDSSLDFVLVVWVRMHRLKTKTGLKSDYYHALYRMLEEAGIEIPFPQQDLHLRSVDDGLFERIERLKGGRPSVEDPP